MDNPKQAPDLQCCIGHNQVSVQVYICFWVLPFVPSNPATPRPGICVSKENEFTISKRYLHTLFFAALFTIAKTCKQPKGPLMSEWIKKLWYIYTVKCYSAIENKEAPPFVTIC